MKMTVCIKRRLSVTVLWCWLALLPGGGTLAHDVHKSRTIRECRLPTTALSLTRGGAIAPRRRHRAVKSLPSTASLSSSSTKIPEGTASIPNEVFNIVKSIVGAGVLGLPAAIAAFGNAPSALIPSMILLIVIGSLAAYGFSLIGTVCAQTRSTSYRQAWSRSVGDGTSWMPALACLLVTACTVLTYSMVLADTVPSIVSKATGIALSRSQALLGTTVIVLLPLCLMKQLSSLAPFSLVGIVGMLYTALAMMVRWLTGAYGEQGAFFAEVAPQFQPSFGSKGWKAVLSPNTALYVSCLSTAFMAHYNAPKFYWELVNNTLSRYNTVVACSFAGAVTIMALVSMAGFGTFGAACSSLILNNYAANDGLMSMSRIAVTISLIFSYPLAFVGVREGLLDLLQVPASKRDGLSNPLTLLLLAIITGLAFVVKDIRIILALGGATWGNCVIYLFPSLMLIAAAKQQPALKKEVPRAMGTGLLGLVLGAIGTARAIKSF